MRHPISSLTRGKERNDNAISQPPAAARLDGNYAEKLKLATHLHEQGINPARWQEAEPGPHEMQKRFRETRQASEDMFVVHDRLYRRSPALAATPAQGKDALDVYLGAAPRPVSELAPVDQVQLRHPLGNKPDMLPTGQAALERYRRYAKLGIDPDRAHEGDAVPYHLQDGLKRAVLGADGKEIPLGITGVYRNPDDGFFYLAHSGTEEDEAVKNLRRRLAKEKMERTGSADPVAANDNDPDIDEAVAQFYWQTLGGKQQHSPRHQEQIGKGEPTSDIAQEFHTRLELIISALKKDLSGDDPTQEEKRALTEFLEFAHRHDRSMQRHEIDIQELERIGKDLNNPEIGSALMAGLAATYAGSSTIGSLPNPLSSTMQKALPYLSEAGAAARWLSGIGTFAMLMRPKETAGPQPGENAPISSSEEMMDLLAAQVAEIFKPTIPEEAKTTEAEVLQEANDNLPDPANDNDPSRGPNTTAAVATTVTAGLLSADSKETSDESVFAPPEKFDSQSQNMRDFQEDFAHAILQGQLPEIWLDGKLITPPNPHGSRGSPVVQELDERTAIAVKKALENCKGVQNVQRVGGGDNLKQFHVGDPDAKGIKNSVRVDLTLGFKHGKYTCLYHINSIDVTKLGEPTARELLAAEKLRKNTLKIAQRFGEAISRNMANAEMIGKSGYSLDLIRKPTPGKFDEINDIIKEFMTNVFSCSGITRKCTRTAP